MRLCVLMLVTLFSALGQCATAGGKNLYGYIEKATLVDTHLTLSAKLDTGAQSSSLNAINIKKENIKGKIYLRFDVPSAKGLDSFLCEYIGQVEIKARARQLKYIDRPLVLMKIRLGHQEKVLPVNLANRSHFIYPLLLGRQAIVAFGGVIDPSKTYQLAKKEPQTSESS